MQLALTRVKIIQQCQACGGVFQALLKLLFCHGWRHEGFQAPGGRPENRVARMVVIKPTALGDHQAIGQAVAQCFFIALDGDAIDIRDKTFKVLPPATVRVEGVKHGMNDGVVPGVQCLVETS